MKYYNVNPDLRFTKAKAANKVKAVKKDRHPLQREIDIFCCKIIVVGIYFLLNFYDIVY